MFLGINLPWKKLPSGDVQFGGAVVAGGVSVGPASSVVPARLRTRLDRRVRIGTGGYSLGSSFAGSYMDILGTAWVIPASASTQVFLESAEIGYCLQSEKYIYTHNFGIGGETVAQILARNTAASSVSRKSSYDIAASGIDVLIVPGLLVNDAQTWSETTVQATVDTVYATTLSLLTQWSGSVPTIIFTAALGCNPSGWSGARQTAVSGWIRYLADKLIAWTKQQSNVVYLEMNGILSDNFVYYPADTIDGLHLSQTGGYKWSSAVQAVLDNLYDVRITDPILHDAYKDWSTVVSNLPTGMTRAAFGTATLQTPSTVNGVCKSPFTTANADNDGIYVEFPGAASALRASGLVAGETFYLEVEYSLHSASTDEILESKLLLYSRPYNVGNAGSIMPTYTEGIVPAKRIRTLTYPTKLDRDASTLGTSTAIRLTAKPGAVGSYYLLVYPPKLRKML